MASIGSFKKVGNEFQGQIVTLSVQAKSVRIAPEMNRANENAPAHRVFVGKADYAECGVMRSGEAEAERFRGIRRALAPHNPGAEKARRRIGGAAPWGGQRDQMSLCSPFSPWMRVA